jgi:hypothetical protein
MWDDLVIGEGKKGNSAILVFKIKGKHSISESSTAYWISDCFLDCGITVFKDTKEGKELTALIDAEVGLENINRWLDCLLLSNLSPHVLKEKILAECNRYFDQGAAAKARDFRRLLDIE